MLPLSPPCLVLRIDLLHDRYPGGWEQFLRELPAQGDDRDAALFRIDARDDAELAGTRSPRELLARALTRMAMTEMLRDDFSLLEIRHSDGRVAFLHRYGEQHGFDTPLPITARKEFFDEPRGSGTPYRNFTEILADGWLAESCAGERPAAPFEGITLQEVI